MDTRIELTEHRIHIGDTTIELEDHQIGQLRGISGGLDLQQQDSALDTVVERIREFLEDCGRPVNPVTIQQEAQECFGVHLYLAAQEHQDPPEE